MNKSSAVTERHRLVYEYVKRNPQIEYLEIEEMFHVSRSVILKIKTMLQSNQPFEPIKMGRHPKINQFHIEEVKNRTIEECTVGCEKLSNQLLSEPKIGKTTVLQIRHSLGFNYTQRRTAPILSEQQIIERIQFCKRNLHTNWYNVLFTDESRFCLESDSPCGWIKRGMYNEDSFIHSAKFSKSIMFWGGIIFMYQTPLLLCATRQNTSKYIELLVNGKVVERINKDMNDDTWLFQQDNAPCHVSKIAMKFLNGHVKMLDKWPANSSDLSPIEQIWAIIKRRLMNRKINKIDELEKAVVDEWNKISPETIQGLVNSVRYRMELCIANEGKYVGHLLHKASKSAKSKQ